VPAATVSHVAECPDLGPECFEPGPDPVPYNHHVELWNSEIALDASLGITPWFAAEVRAALRIVDVNPSYSELDGTPKQVPGDIHHHDETLVGPSDPWIVGRFGARAGDLVTTARLGFTLPLASTEPNPYTLGRRGISHQHIQLGTGVVMPIVGGGVAWVGEPANVSLSYIGIYGLYENGEGFRPPSRTFLELRAGLPLLEDRLEPFVVADLAHESEELWDGLPGLEGSNVRTDLLLGGGAVWTFTPGWAVDASVRARAARFTDAAAFDQTVALSLGVRAAFDLWTDGADDGGVAAPAEIVVP
jgi:hypothetical protein